MFDKNQNINNAASTVSRYKRSNDIKPYLGSCFLEAPRAGILNEVSRISNSITRTVRYDTSVGDRRQRYAAGRGPVGFRFRSGWRGRWSYFTAYDRYDTRTRGTGGGT